MNWYGCIPRFLKAHGSLILSILSGIGLVGTVVATAKQAPKAEKELREELAWKISHRVDEMMDEAEANGHGTEPEDWTDDEHAELYDLAERDTRLTMTEKIKVAGPIYAPVILLGLATMGCIAGAQILSVKQQAVMAMAYSMLSQDFGAYRKEIRDEYGAEADRKAYISSQKKIQSLEAEIRRLENIKGVLTFGISTIPGLIFRSDMANIERAFLHFNRNLAMRGENNLEELYSFLGIPTEHPFLEYPGHSDAVYGWNEYENEVTWGSAFVDYQFQEISTKNGEKLYLIDFPVPPYKIDGGEYGEGQDSVDQIFPGYEPTEARDILKRGAESVPMLIDSATHIVDYPGMFEVGVF